MKSMILSILLLASINLFAQTGSRTTVQKKRPLADSVKSLPSGRDKISQGDDWEAPVTGKRKRKNNFGGEDWDVKSPTDSIGKAGGVKKNKQLQTKRRKKRPTNNFGGEEWDRKPLQNKQGVKVDSVRSKQSN